MCIENIIDDIMKYHPRLSRTDAACILHHITVNKTDRILLKINKYLMAKYKIIDIYIAENIETRVKKILSNYIGG